MEPGAKVEIKYLRDVQEKTAQVELAELPTEQGRFAQNDSSATGAVLGGVTIAEIDDRMRQQYNLPPDLKGALITNVAPDSPAGEAGLREGDVIREIARQDVNRARDAIDLNRKIKTDKGVVMLVWSNGSQRYLVVNPSETDQQRTG
jgi:serine protease Do